MPNEIASHIYHRITAAVHHRIRSLSACCQARHWRRATLRALRQRSRE